MLPRNNIDTMWSAGRQARVGVAVVVGEARGTQEQTRALPAAGDDDAEVRPARKLFLLLLGHLHLDSGQELDRLARADRPPRDNARFVRQDRVAVRGADFEGAFREVHVDVFAQVALEVFLLILSAQRPHVLCDSGEAQEVGVREASVFADDDIFAEDCAYCFLLDAA
jgi:hypothetical protein